MTTRPSRREFLKTAAAGVAASRADRCCARRRPVGRRRCRRTSASSSRLIGVGIQGMSDTRTALRVPGVELVAVADIYDGRLTLVEGAVGRAALHHARLSRGAGAAGRRRRHHRHARSLAREASPSTR